LTARLRSTADIRAEFPALGDGGAALDGAGGTQVPTAVVEAVGDGFRTAMSNLGGTFAGSASARAWWR
jgi:selenocysteine lyase/cysteine desulfurase